MVLEKFSREVAEWIEGAVDDLAFGEITVKIVVHGGKITRWERSTAEKIQVEAK